MKQKILSLNTEEDRQRMMDLLLALQKAKISKSEFMRRLNQEFPAPSK